MTPRSLSKDDNDIDHDNINDNQTNKENQIEMKSFTMKLVDTASIHERVP